MVTKEDLAQAILELKESGKKADRKIATMLGNIGNNQGDVAEEFFWNSMSHNPHISRDKVRLCY